MHVFGLWDEIEALCRKEKENVKSLNRKAIAGQKIQTFELCDDTADLNTELLLHP